MDIMKNLCGIKTEIKVTSTFVPFIASLLGDKWRSIPKIRGVGMSSILKVIERACSREVIAQGAQMLGWELDDLLSRTLEVMKPDEAAVAAETAALA